MAEKVNYVKNFSPARSYGGGRRRNGVVGCVETFPFSLKTIFLMEKLFPSPFFLRLVYVAYRTAKGMSWQPFHEHFTSHSANKIFSTLLIGSNNDAEALKNVFLSFRLLRDDVETF